MEILILGGTRFVGLRLVEALVKVGHQVTVLNRGVTPAKLPPQVQRLIANRSDQYAMARALFGRSFDAVCDISGLVPQEITLVVKALKARVGHYLYCSSVAVYTPSEHLPTVEDSSLLQDSGDQGYGLKKLRCEKYLDEASRSYGFPVTHLRPCTTYGPHNTVKEREFAYFARLEQHRTILLPVCGLTTLVPLVHVDDVAQGFSRALGNPCTYRQAFNISGEGAVTLLGLIQLMAEIVGVEPDIALVPPGPDRYLEWSPVFPFQPGSYPFQWRRSQMYAIEKAKALLGYAPYDLHEGLKRTHEWYKFQPSGSWQWDFSRDEECLQLLAMRRKSDSLLL